MAPIPEGDSGIMGSGMRYTPAEETSQSASRDSDSRGLLAPSLHIPTRVILPVLGSFALLIYVLFIGFLPDRLAHNESTDYSRFYRPVAENLVTGEGLVTADGRPAVRYPPGYPLILAGLLEVARVTEIRETLILRLFTSLTVLATTLLVFGIAALVFDQGTALLAAALFATYPFYLWLTKQPNSEIPFFPIFLLAMYVFLRSLHARQFTAWRGLAVGALVGLASLMRPFTVALGAVLLFALWVSARECTVRQRMFFSVLLVLGNALVVLPWDVWAWKKTGQWMLLSTNGPPSVVDGLTFALKEGGAGRTLTFSPEVRGLMQDVKDQSGELQSVAAIGGFLAGKFVHDPSPVASLILLKARRAWYANDTQSHEGWVALLQAPYLLFAAVGGTIAAGLGSGQRRFTLIVLLVTFYFWIMTTMVLSILRYMVPAMALLMPFVSVGVISAGKALWDDSKRRQLAAVLHGPGDRAPAFRLEPRR